MGTTHRDIVQVYDLVSEHPETGKQRKQPNIVKNILDKRGIGLVKERLLRNLIVLNHIVNSTLHRCQYRQIFQILNLGPVEL